MTELLHKVLLLLSSSLSEKRQLAVVYKVPGGTGTVVVTGITVLASLGVVLLVAQQQLKPKIKKKSPCPKVPGSLPFIGNPLIGGFSTVYESLREWIIEYGNIPSNSTGLLECTLFGNKFFLICNNSVAEEVAKLRPNKLQRPHKEEQAIDSIGAGGVFSAEGQVWRNERRLFAPPLNHKNLKDYMPFIRTVTKRLLTKWEEQIRTTVASGSSSSSSLEQAVAWPAPAVTVAVNQDLLSYTIDNIGLIAFDQDFDCLRKSFSQEVADLRYIFRRLRDRCISPLQYWRIPFVGQYLDGVGFSSGRLLRNLAATVQSFEQDSQTGDRSRTYLEKIIVSQNTTTMTKERVMGNLLTMFLAGTETTGNTIMICLWELLQEDRTGQLLDDLVQEVLGLGDLEQVSLDDVFTCLPQLRAFFYEVVRLKGTAPYQFLESSESVQVAGLEFPKGTTFATNFAYLSTLEGSGIPTGPKGESPAIFCSQRWLVRRYSDVDDDNHPQQQWNVIKPAPKMGVSLCSGFGNGVRICPGQDLAELEVIYCLASILKHFEISLKPNHPPVKMITAFTQSPDRDIELCLKPRQV